MKYKKLPKVPASEKQQRWAGFDEKSARTKSAQNVIV